MKWQYECTCGNVRLIDNFSLLSGIEPCPKCVSGQTKSVVLIDEAADRGGPMAAIEQQHLIGPNGEGVNPGLWRLHWNDGGSSLASVGCDESGRRWFAPVNWVGGVPCFDWSMVEVAELIEAHNSRETLCINGSVMQGMFGAGNEADAKAFGAWMRENYNATSDDRRLVCESCGAEPSEHHSATCNADKVRHYRTLINRQRTVIPDNRMTKEESEQAIAHNLLVIAERKRNGGTLDEAAERVAKRQELIADEPTIIS